VPAHPLSLRVVLLSWALAVVLWPVAWWGVAIAQGLGVLFAGGGWIGIAVPLGSQPWALVNEPDIAYASSRAAPGATGWRRCRPGGARRAGAVAGAVADAG
jgi:hypothetical protein